MTVKVLYYTTTEYDANINRTMALLEDKIHACFYYVQTAWLGNKNVEEWMRELRQERGEDTMFHFVKVQADQEPIASGIVCVIKPF